MLHLADLIDYHVTFYKSQEKQHFDRARRLYRGEAWHGKGAPPVGASTRMLASKNMVYAIADTAISSLLGPNPKVASRPRNQAAEKAKGAINGLMDYIFETNNLRSRASTTLVDATLCGRGIFKTGWNAGLDTPWIRDVDPSRMFFDLSVRNVEDISYWAEATPIRYTEFKRRVQDGRYRPGFYADDKKYVKIEPDAFPPWLQVQGDEARDKVRSAHQWVNIYEYYDAVEGTVTHYHHPTKTVLAQHDIHYIPYSMYFLNHNSMDCRGLAEVQLILPQQQTINELLTLLKQVTYLQIPRILYDSGQISESDLNKVLDSATGAFIGIDPENSDTLRTLGNLFYAMPTPTNPPDVKEFLAMMTEDTAFISALAEMARGQVTGARTATEMALVDTQMRTRLGTREGHLHSAIADVAKKSFYLARRRMSRERIVRVTGNVEWTNVTHALLSDLESDFSVNTYNPIQRNPGVLAETVVSLSPLLQENPFVDLYQLTKAIFDGVGFPESALKTPEEVEKEAAEAAEAEAAMMEQQTAAGGGGAPGAEGLPPEIAAAMGGGAGPAAMGAPVAPPAAIVEPTDPATGLPIGRDPTAEELMAVLANGAQIATVTPPGNTPLA